MRRLLAAALLAPVFLAGCGGSDSSDSDEAGRAGKAEEASSPEPSGTPDGVGDVSASDEHTIKDNLTAWLLAPRCDLATDDYLIRLTPFADEDTTADEACDQWTNGFVKPAFGADDILFSNLEGAADRATIEVGSEYINVTTTYEMTFVDGTWKVSGDDFTDDDL